MEGADESTELWPHPKAVVFIKYEKFGPMFLLSSCYQKARLFTVIFNLPKKRTKVVQKNCPSSGDPFYTFSLSSKSSREKVASVTRFTKKSWHFVLNF